MTREKIIEIVNDCVQYNANQGTWAIDNRFADTLLAEFEQEKKEAFKKGYEEGYDNGYDDCDAKHFAEEYGVEL